MPTTTDESVTTSINPLPISSANNKSPLYASQTTDTSSVRTKHSPLSTPVHSTFDWETDGEDSNDLTYNDSKLKRTGTTTKKTRFNGCILWFRRWPHFVRTVMYIILGGIFFMIPGMASYWFCINNDVKGQFMTKGWSMYDDSDTCGFAMGVAPGRIPAFVLFVWFSVSWASYFGNRYLFAVLPNVLVRMTSLFVKFTVDDEKFAAKAAHIIDYIGFLRKFLSLFIWGVTNNFTWAIFFRTIEGFWSEGDWRYVVQRVLSCIMFCFMILLIEKTFLQVISVGFHKRAYHQRILDHDKANKVLIRLNRGRKKMMKSKGMYSSTESLESDGEPAVLHDRLDRQFKMFAGKAAKAGESFGKGFASVIGAAVGLDIGGAATGVVLRSPADVRILAKKLFEAICRRGFNNDLRLDDFTPFFNTPEEAKEAFDLFDRDGNGDVTKSEFKSVVRSIYEEGVQLDFSLRQSSQAISKLDDLFKVFMYIIILFVCLGIFNVDTTKFMAAAISLWLGIVFAIGGTIKNLVESIIFLFITHPYDVGDKVEVDGTAYFVRKFGLMTTVFTGVDGKEIYAPNIELASKFLHNFRRSGPTGESINFRFAFSTPWLKIKQLETFLRKYVENEESREFVPLIEIKVTDIVSKECINCFIWLEHRSNWQSGPDKSTRTNRFLLKAKEGIEILEIELAKVWVTDGGI